MTLSVIIPVYNTADYLPRCQDSLLGQDLTGCEILLVDDGSTDGKSALLCDEYARTHPETVRVIHQENRGVGGARNRGVEEAHGEYLLFVDSDDYLSPRLVSVLKPWMARGVDAVCFDYVLDDGRRIIPQEELPLPDGSLTTLRESPQLLLAAPSAVNKLWRRSLFTGSGVRFPERALFEDLATTGKLLALAQQIGVVREPLYHYVVRSGSIMRGRNAARDLEIIDALRGLADWFRESGLFVRYRAELEALAVKHVLLAASVRVLKDDPDSHALKVLADYVRQEYPVWRRNPYVRSFPARHRLLLQLIQRRHYRLIRRIFQIKDQL